LAIVDNTLRGHGEVITRNPGAGADIGIYSRPTYMAQDRDGLDHYFADTSLTMPMQLYLYNNYGSSNIENIFSWQPSEEQWWITGFNPEHVGIADMTKQVMVACVDFSEYTDANGKNEMYDELKDALEELELDKKYVILDEDEEIVWIMWYEGDPI